MATQDISLNPKIKNAAIEVFLEKGYLNASLKEICKKAGVTTGAIYNRYKGKEGLFSSLVEPTIENLSNFIIENFNKYSENTKDNLIYYEWEKMEDEYLMFLDFLYDNFQGFKLLFCRSNGSQYSNFKTEIIDKCSKESYEILKTLYENGKFENLIDQNEYHLIHTASYSAMFEVIEHDFEKKDAIKYFKILNKFFNWENILSP